MKINIRLKKIYDLLLKFMRKIKSIDRIKTKVGVIITLVLLVSISVWVQIWPGYAENKAIEYNEYAIMAENAGDFTLTKKCYQEVLRYEKKNMRALLGLFNIFIEERSYLEAEYWAGMFIKYYPVSPIGFLNMAKTVELQGNIDAALALAGYAVDRTKAENVGITGVSMWAYPYVYAGDLMLKTGDKEKARGYYRNVLIVCELYRKYLQNDTFEPEVMKKYLAIGGTKKALAKDITEGRKVQTMN